jgi:hypothetical protein
MDMHDDLDARWREGLHELAPAPAPVEPAHDRVLRRVAVRRHRRQRAAGAAIVMIGAVVTGVTLNARHTTNRLVVGSSPTTLAPSTTRAPSKIFRSETFHAPYPGAPTIDAIVDDAGLHLSRLQVPGGMYNIAFVDRRSQRASDDRVVYDWYVTGPLIAQGIAAGTTGGVLLCPGATGQMVVVNGRALALEHQDEFNLLPSDTCTTPVT